jgi:hypothetical protein
MVKNCAPRISTERGCAAEVRAEETELFMDLQKTCNKKNYSEQGVEGDDVINGNFSIIDAFYGQ